MAIVLHNLERLSEAGKWSLHAEVDGTATRIEITSTPDGRCSGVDENSFFLLSNRALAEVGDCGAYHAAIMQLIVRASNNEPLMLPIELGKNKALHPRRWWQFWRSA